MFRRVLNSCICGVREGTSTGGRLCRARVGGDRAPGLDWARGVARERARRLRGAGAGVVTVTVSLAPVFQTPRFRAFRASLFAALGLWGIAPAFHSFLLHGAERAVRRAFAHDLAMGAIYLVRARAPAASRRCSCGSHSRAGNAIGLL